MTDAQLAGAPAPRPRPARSRGRRGPRPAGSSSPGWATRLPAVDRGMFLRAALVSLLAWAVAYVVLALVPSYTAAALGGSNLLVDGTAAGSLLLVAAAAQAACRSWGADRAQASGLAGLIAGLAGLIAAGAAGSAALLFGAIAVAGAGQGLAFMGSIGRVNEIAPADQRAGTVAMFYVLTYGGSGLVTAAVGLLATHLGLTRAVQAAAAVLAAACLLTLVTGGRAGRTR